MERLICLNMGVEWWRWWNILEIKGYSLILFQMVPLSRESNPRPWLGPERLHPLSKGDHIINISRHGYVQLVSDAFDIHSGQPQIPLGCF